MQKYFTFGSTLIVSRPRLYCYYQLPTTTFLTMPPRTSKLHRSNSVKTAALTLMKSGQSAYKVSKDLNISKSTLSDWKKAAIACGNWVPGPSGDVTHAAPRKPGSGYHRRKISDSLLVKIDKVTDNDPFLTSGAIKQKIPGLADVASRTIRDALVKDLKKRSRKAAIKPLLSDVHLDSRVDWAFTRRNWTKRKWSTVLWSDETHMEQWSTHRHAARVRRHATVSRYHRNFIRRSVKHPPKIMIWGCFGNGKLGRLYFVEQNRKMNTDMYQECLNKHLKASMRMTDDGLHCFPTRRSSLPHQWQDEDLVCCSQNQSDSLGWTIM